MDIAELLAVRAGATQHEVPQGGLKIGKEAVPSYGKVFIVLRFRCLIRICECAGGSFCRFSDSSFSRM
jgi:hypothetical protein